MNVKCIFISYRGRAVLRDESGIVVAGDADERDGGDKVGGSVDVSSVENVLEEIDLSGHIRQWNLSVEHSCSSVRKVHSVL